MLECSLAGVFVRHEMALVLVCGDEFSCELSRWACTADLGGSWGHVWPETGRKPTREFPARLHSGTQLLQGSFLSDPQFINQVQLISLIRGLDHFRHPGTVTEGIWASWETWPHFLLAMDMGPDNMCAFWWMISRRLPVWILVLHSN